MWKKETIEKVDQETVRLQKFYFPEKEISIEATTLEEAIEKLNS